MLKEKLFFIEYLSTLNCRATVQNSSFCVEFAFSPRVHKGFPPLRTPTEKTCKITEHMSIPDQRWFTSLGPRALQAAHCSWGVLEVQDGKKQKINSPQPQAYLCVCPVSPPYMHVCVPVCRVCHKNPVRG